MQIKITSLCLGNIDKKQTIRREFKSNSFCTDTIATIHKENALLIRVGNGYVDIDSIKDEKALKSLYKEVNALGEFRNGCGILKDTVPFDENEGDLFVDYESIRDTSYQGKSISLKKLKEERIRNGKNINYRR